MQPGEPALVLMADDDDDDCLLARDAYQEAGGPGVIHCVGDGIALMDYLAGSRILPGLILLDLNMPRKDGRQVLKEIKTIPDFKDIPVVVFTTSRAEKDKASSRELGAESFYTKPVSFGEWVRIMKSLADKWLPMQ